jgi:uncharacterized membrane protein YecN with MAPEG domain
MACCSAKCAPTATFVEHVPLALLFILALEVMQASVWLVWMLGITLTVARIAHAWGLIKTYGPSPGRAIGFFPDLVCLPCRCGACIYRSLLALG